MQRARHTHQKLARREAILAVALGILEDTPFRDITMTQVAARAGLVKGTLYLYFATREELFLEVLRDQFHGWFWDLEAGLDTLPRRGRLEAAARLMANTTATRPAFRCLLEALHGTLEQNLPEETASAFKRELLARMVSMGAILERSLPFLAAGQGFRLLIQVYALIIGIQAMAEPGAMVHKIMEQPDFDSLRLDYSQEFLNGVRTLLFGLKTENRSGQTGHASHKH
jgi:TetR/AcrR family transcriptional regulator